MAFTYESQKVSQLMRSMTLLWQVQYPQLNLVENDRILLVEYGTELSCLLPVITTNTDL